MLKTEQNILHELQVTGFVFNKKEKIYLTAWMTKKKKKYEKMKYLRYNLR